MESVCKKPCVHNEYLYELSTDKASFVKAVNNCINNGGSLASDLHREAYETINTCCAFSTGDYYIGLRVTTDTRCMDTALRFQWLQSKNCSDGNPLEITNFKINRQCVTIAQQTSLLPKAKARNCNNKRRYICQTKYIPTTQSNKPTKMLSFETISSASSTVNTDAAAFNAVLIPTLTGVLVCIFLLALILLCFFLHKKGFLKRFRNNNELIALTNSDLKDTQNNPLYDG